MAKNSPAGFPDEILVRGTRMIAAELKSDVGRVTGPQQEWLDALAQVPGVETFIWRPGDVDAIAQVLR